MAGEARNYGVIGERAILKRPWARGGDGLHEFADRSSKMHTVASQAVVHQEVFLVEFLVKENVTIRDAVRSGLPVGVFLLVASLAIGHDLGNVPLPDANLLRSITSQVCESAPHVVQVESSIKRENVSVAFRTFDIAVRGSMPIRVRLPDFVAPRARPAVGSFVVQARARHTKNDKHPDTESQVHTARTQERNSHFFSSAVYQIPRTAVSLSELRSFP